MPNQTEQQSPEYDYAGYTNSLERIFQVVERDYWATCLDINKHQINVARMYLWVSLAILGLCFAGLELWLEIIVDTNLSNILLIAAGIVFAILSFVFCLYSVPARKGYKQIYKKGWGELSQSAHDILCEKNEHIYARVLTDLISKTDDAIKHNHETNRPRATLLRWTSYLLIASIIFSVAGFAKLIIENVQAVI